MPRVGAAEWRTSLRGLPNVSGVQRRRRLDETGRRLPGGPGAARPRPPDPRRRRRRGRRAARARAAPGAPGAASCGWPTRPATVDGWESPHTVVEVVSDDAPFLVDSVSTALARRGYDIHLLFHPLLEVAGVGPTSHLHLEIDRETEPDGARRAARRDRERRRRRVRRGGRLGRAPRRGRPGSPAALRASPPDGVTPEETAEVATYLDWLADDHFTFVGAVQRRRRRRGRCPARSSASRAGGRCSISPTPIPRPPGSSRSRGHAARSTVHRDVPLDSVTVRVLHADGTTERRAAAPRALHRQRVQRQRRVHPGRAPQGGARCWRESGFPPDSHDGRDAGQRAGHLPARRALPALHRRARRRSRSRSWAWGCDDAVRLFVSRDRVGCFVSCLVYLPRDRYTTPVRELVVDALLRARTAASDADFTVLVTEELMARLHVVVDTPSGCPDVDAAALEARARRRRRATGSTTCTTRSSTRSARSRRRPVPGVARRVPARRTRPRCRRRSRSTTSTVLERLDPDGDLQVRLEPPMGEAVAHIKLYRAGGRAGALRRDAAARAPRRHRRRRAPLRDRRARRARVGIYSFGVRGRRRRPARRPRHAGAASPRCSSACGRARSRTTGSTGWCCTPGSRCATWSIVRALCQYLRQAGVRFTDAYLADTLHDNADVVRLLVGALPRPARSGASATTRDRARSRRSLDDELGARHRRGREPRRRPHPARAVAGGARDRAHQRVPRRGAPRVQVRSHRARLPARSRTRSTRSGWRRRRSRACTCARATSPAAASGGPTGARTSAPRCSGSMKAQTVKNAVIVPVGAKGGFYVKRGDSKSAYQTFIRGLLELTDNRRGRRRSCRRPTWCAATATTPYLVVAADKGTGAFSDVANALAAEYGYWLGDAFASGGSAGFDHKEMGITSRGAWLSVKAHFRALDVDADTAPPHRRRHRRHVGRRVRQRAAALTPRAAGRRVRPPPRVRRSRSRSRGVVRASAGGCSRSRRRRGPTTTPPCCRPVAGCTRARAKSVDLSAAARRVLGVGDGVRSRPTRW